MSKTKYSLGVDIGGTTIKFGLVSETGKIKSQFKLDTHADEGPASVISQIKKGIHKILKNKKVEIEGIGIGSPGIVTSKKGIVQNPPNFAGWNSVALGNIIKKEFKTHVYVENDANAAAVGEMIFGAGKNYSDFLMVTLGTGVGGGIIINGKLYKGVTGAAGEIGHVKIKYDGVRCKCGGTGCLEAYSGINYLVERVKTKLEKNNSILNKWIKNDSQKLTPKLIHEAALKNDNFSIQVINELAGQIGIALSSVVNLFDITTIIIGGGIAGFGDFLFDPLTNTLIENVMEPMKKRIRVIPAKLKNNAGIKGASALVFYRL